MVSIVNSSARIRISSEFLAIQEECLQLSSLDIFEDISFTIGYFIDLAIPDDVELTEPSTILFSYSDSKDKDGLSLFHTNIVEFPWLFGQPNNFENGNEKCAVMLYVFNGESFVNDGKLHDFICSPPVEEGTHGFVCEILVSEKSEVFFEFIHIFIGGVFMIFIFLSSLLIMREIKLRKTLKQINNIYK